MFGGRTPAIEKAEPVATKDDPEVLRKKKEETRMAANRVGLGKTANVLGQDLGTANTQRTRLLGRQVA